METVNIPIFAILVALFVFTIISENLLNWFFRKVNDDNESLIVPFILIYLIRTVLVVAALYSTVS